MRYDFEIEATGTKWIVSLWSESLNVGDSQKIWESCVFTMQGFELTYSRFRDDSFLSGLSAKRGSQKVPADMITMLRLYEKLYKASDGLVTPLGGNAIADLGYDASYSFEKKERGDTVPELYRSVEIIDNTHLKLNEQVSFDLGALGKGFLIDLVMEKIREVTAVERVLVNAGGDIAHWSRDGEKARIALENPDNTDEAIGIVEIGNEAIASSASNKRRWGTHNENHHIYNPKEGKSTETLKAAWVVSDMAAVADGIATSLFLVSPENCATQFTFDYAILTEKGDFRHSEKFNKAFFTEET